MMDLIIRSNNFSKAQKDEEQPIGRMGKPGRNRGGGGLAVHRRCVLRHGPRVPGGRRIHGNLEKTNCRKTGAR